MKGFEKGKPKTGGRQAGTPNKCTQVNREFISALLDRQAEKMERELEKLEGREYWSVILALNEYRMPKLQRIQVEDMDNTTQHTITWIGQFKGKDENLDSD